MQPLQQFCLSSSSFNEQDPKLHVLEFFEGAALSGAVVAGVIAWSLLLLLYEGGEMRDEGKVRSS